MNEEDIKKFYKILTDNKIKISAVYEPIGCLFYLSANDVIDLIKDRDKFFANECAISKDDYIEWKNFVMSNCQCTAHNKNGIRCRNKIKDAQNLSPQSYVQRRDTDNLYCNFHCKNKD